MLTLGLTELILGLRVPTLGLGEQTLGVRVLNLGLCELTIVLRKLTLDSICRRSEIASPTFTNFMRGRFGGVNTNLRELVPTWCHFKQFNAIHITCYYILVF